MRLVIGVKLNFIKSMITLMIIFFATIGDAQKKVDTSFTLLWYKGKKINDSTLLTPGGTRVSYSSSRNLVNHRYPPGKDPFQNLRNQISKAGEFKMKIDKILIGSLSSPRPPGFVVQANKVIDKVCGQFESLTDNNFPLDHSEVQTLTTEPDIMERRLPAHVLQYYNDVMDYVNKPDPGSDFAMIPPPSMPMDYCYPCDQERQAKYQADSAAFMGKFLKTELFNLSKISVVLIYLDKQRPKTAADSSFIAKVRSDFFVARGIILDRIENKVIAVWNTYKNLPEKLPFLVSVVFNIMEQTAFFHGGEFTNVNILTSIAERLSTAVVELLDKAKRDRDFTVMLNYNWIFRALVSSELLGRNEGILELFQEYTEINKFKVVADPEVKFSGEGTNQQIKLKFDEHYMAYPDRECKLKWEPYIIRPDWLKGLSFKVEVMEWKAPEYAPTYKGTKEFGALLPQIKLDFCDEKRDTALFFSFFAINGKEQWEVKGQVQPIQLVTYLFMAAFTNEEELKKRMAEIDPVALQAQMTSAYGKGVAPNTGALNLNFNAMNPEDFEKIAELMEAAEKVAEVNAKAQIYQFLLKARLKNFQNIVFDETLNGKTISSVPYIDLANYKVRIEWAGK